MDTKDQQVLVQLARAEARAQAKVMAKDIADQFNMIRKGDVDSFDKLARCVNTLGVMVEVLIDLAADPRPLQSEGLPADKRRKFSALCDVKAAAFAEKNDLSLEVKK